MKKSVFSVSAGAVTVAAAAYFFDAGYLIVLTLIAVCVHELGHYAAIKLCGGHVSSVRLCLTGVIIRSGGLSTYTGDIIIAASGPAASLLLAGLSAWLARSFYIDAAYRIAGLSLVFCVFNLLPIMPLDGGRILHGITARLFGLEAAEKIVFAAGCVVILVVLCCGVYVLRATGNNVTLLLCGVWLCFMNFSY